MKKSYWLSYDLGVGGDYAHLYQWLDDHDALPCGNSVAFFSFSYISDDAEKELLEDIKRVVDLQPGNILYLIRKKDDGNGSVGSFIYGKRQSTPWDGYGTKTEDSLDE